MAEPFERTERLLGEGAMEKLRNARVAVFGIGGVGGYVCEALVRSGVGAFDLIDSDRVDMTNLNRQIIATRDTVGRKKVEVMAERMRSISPEVKVRVYPTFFLPENADSFPFGEYDYIVDAVDTVTAKLALVEKAIACGVPVISAMGAGNKMEVGGLRVADISETKVCPLARVMRRELKKRNIFHLKVVYSEEPPLSPRETGGEELPEETPEEVSAEIRGEASEEFSEELPTGRPLGGGKKRAPGSNAFVPAAAGLFIACEVVKDLIGYRVGG